MPGPWITDNALADAVASVLQRGSAADLEQFWTQERVPRANAQAANLITARLRARGFSVGSIDAWDDRESFNRALGLYFALVDGALPFGMLPEQIKLYDRRKELDTLLLTIAGEPVAPGSPTSDGGFAVGHGRMADFAEQEDANTKFQW